MDGFNHDMDRMTASLCPVCLARIPAERRLEGDDCVLVKECLDHGEFRTVIWRGKPAISAWRRQKMPFRSDRSEQVPKLGCPFDCGICTMHRQQSCAILLEITGRCNLSCRFCYADAGREKGTDPPLEIIADRFRTILRTSGPHNIIQLSGGEPTVREDLPDIIAMGREAGFPYIQLNSNGLRLAVEPGYAQKLREAGLFSVFLQFDGTEDGIYLAIRGRALLRQKMLAIENCVSNGLGVVLVATIVPRVNTGNVGAILRLALDRAPFVRGVHFQPVSYFGRHPGLSPSPPRFTLPELMRAIEEQTGSLMKAEHFRPPGCEHPLCSFHGNFMLLPDGGLKALTNHTPSCCSDAAELGTARAVSYVAEQWKAPSSSSADGGMDSFLKHFRDNIFAVSAMAFQDALNLDLDRVRECCIHVVAADGRMVPFCLYNLTAVNGTPLYRGGAT